VDRRQGLPGEAAGHLVDTVVGQRFAGPGLDHQPGGQVDLVADGGVGAAHRAADRAGEQPPAGQADVQRLHVGQRPQQRVGGGGGPLGRVLQRRRRAEQGHQLAALVPNADLAEGAAVLPDAGLGGAHQVVKPRGGVRRGIVQAGEAHEQRRHQAQIGHVGPVPAAQALVDRGREIGAARLHQRPGAVDMIQPADGRPADVIAGRREDGRDQADEAIRQGSVVIDGADGGGGGRADHDLVSLSYLRSAGHALHRRAGQHVVVGDGRIAGAEAAAGAAADGNLEPQGRVAGHDRLHEGLHGDGGDHGAQGGVLPGEPGGEAVAAEAQNRPAVAAGGVDDPAESVVDPLG